jgi:hypothetical protein
MKTGFEIMFRKPISNMSMPKRIHGLSERPKNHGQWLSPISFQIMIAPFVFTYRAYEWVKNKLKGN